MNIELQEPLKNTTAHLYLCLDSMQFENIEQFLYQTEPDPKWAWVYEDTPLASMTKAGPVLVQVSVDSPLLKQWLDEGYQMRWGILLASSAGFDTVLAHLQWLSRVRYPCGTAMLFRYYVPDIADVLFSKEIENEYSQLWGPVIQTGVPDAGNQQLNLWQQKTLPEYEKINTADLPLFQVSEQLFEALQQPARKALRQTLITHMATHFPERWQQWQAETEIRGEMCSGDDLAETLLQRAQALCIEDQSSLLSFANILGWLDWAVLDTDQYPECKSLLTQSSLLTPAMRIQQAESMAEYAVT